MGFSRVQPRAGTAAEWTAHDDILRAGEVGYETDTGLRKYGDGSTPWSGLDYALDAASADAAMASVVSDPGSATAAALDSSTAALVGGTGATGTALDGRFTTVSEAPINAARYVDSDPAVDATAGLQAWLNDVVDARGLGILPPREYRISAALVPGTGASDGWIVEGSGARIIQTTDNVPIFHFQNEGAANWTIRNLVLSYANLQPAANATAVAFYFDSSTSLGWGFYNFTIERITLVNGYRGVCVNETDVSRNPVWGARFRRIISNQTQSGAVIRLRQGTSGQPNIMVDGLYARGDIATEPLLNFQGAHGIKVSNVEVNDCAYSTELVLETCEAADVSTIRSERGTVSANYVGLWTFTNVRGSLRSVEVQDKVFTHSDWTYLIRANSNTELTVDNVSVYSFTATAGGQVAAVNADTAKSVEIGGAFYNPSGATKTYAFDATPNKVMRDVNAFRGMGVVTKVLSGAGKTTVTDADFPSAPANGTVVMVVNSTDSSLRLAVRWVTWKVSAALT